MTNQSNRKSVLRCPKCGSEESLVRIRRHFFERLLSGLVSLRRYHCYYCGWQGLLRSTSSSKRGLGNI